MILDVLIAIVIWYYGIPLVLELFALLVVCLGALASFFLPE